MLGGLYDQPIAYTAARERMLNAFIPFTDYLTQPRSVNELQTLKRELLQIFHDQTNKSGLWGEEVSKTTRRRLDEIRDYLWLFTTFTEFFPCPGMPIKEESPKSIWEMYETVGGHDFRTIDQKITTFDEIVAIAEKNRGHNEARVGLTAGKFRLDTHKAHRRHLERAKIALGREGLLVVGVESRASINSRVRAEQENPGIESLYCKPDQERLEAIAALEAVDYVFLMDPDSQSLCSYQAHCQYFDRVWRDINPNFFFFGSPDHELRNRFKEIGDQLGVYLFWTSETKTSDTTSLIAEIRQATLS